MYTEKMIYPSVGEEEEHLELVDGKDILTESARQNLEREEVKREEVKREEVKREEAEPLLNVKVRISRSSPSDYLRSNRR